jgi:hypothetical protein
MPFNGIFVYDTDEKALPASEAKKLLYLLVKCGLLRDFVWY